MTRSIRPTSLRSTALVLLLPGLALGLVACDDATGVGDPAEVAVNFRTTSTATPTSSSSVPARTGPSWVAGPPLSLDGSNGTLVIEEIRLVIAEIELDGADDLCEDDFDDDDDGSRDGDDDCADFEAGPRFVDLPLDGSPVQAVRGLLPPGVYDELEFEIEDLEDDEDDDEWEEILALRRTILDEFPDWPENATALVVGSFQPTGGAARDFRVYLEAEIEIEIDLNPPLVVSEDDASPALTVDIRPDLWFVRSDGTVLDLSAWDYDTTGHTLEFEAELEDGFVDVEIDD